MPNKSRAKFHSHSSSPPRLCVRLACSQENLLCQAMSAATARSPIQNIINVNTARDADMSILFGKASALICIAVSAYLLHSTIGLISETWHSIFAPVAFFFSILAGSGAFVREAGFASSSEKVSITLCVSGFFAILWPFFSGILSFVVFLFLALFTLVVLYVVVAC